MNLFVYFWLILFQKFSQAVSDQNSDCRSIETLGIHPLDCCIYPRFIDNPPSILHKCAFKCKNEVRFPQFTCQRLCILKETKIIEDGNVNVDGFLKLFFEGGTNDLKELTTKWQEVVKGSIKYCENEFPAKWIEESEAKYLSFYKYFAECIRKMNFINCVDFKVGTENCVKMKTLMENCYVKNYDFLHKILFEDFYYREKKLK